MVNSSNSPSWFTYRCPDRLLNASDDEKLSYFGDQSLVVDHPKLAETIDKVMNASHPGLDQAFIILIGGSGIGKTVLLKQVVRLMNLKMQAQMSENKLLVPAIYIEADPPDKQGFFWRGFYQDCLEQLNAPLIEKTLPLVERSAGEKRIVTVGPEFYGKRPTPYDLRKRLREELKARQNEIVVVDEAVNMFNVGQSARKATQRDLILKAVNSVKSLVNKSSSTVLLGGAYDFFDLVNYRAQVARRSEIVYFSEYGDSPNDINGFTTGALGLMAHMPIQFDVDPSEIMLDLFVQSLGFIGLCRKILFLWMRYSISHNLPMRKENLHHGFFPKATLTTLRNEHNDGRKRVLDLLERDDYVSATRTDSKPNESPPNTLKAPSNLKPGQTKPNRRYKEGPP
jgi:hypothetical protein